MIRMKLLLMMIFVVTQVFGEHSLVQLRVLFKQSANSRVACKQLIVACDEQPTKTFQLC